MMSAPFGNTVGSSLRVFMKMVRSPVHQVLRKASGLFDKHMRVNEVYRADEPSASSACTCLLYTSDAADD